MTPSTKATPRLECPSCRVHPHREPCSRNCAIARNDTLLAENQRLRAALNFYADPRKYQGPNCRPHPDEESVDGKGIYRLDVGRDGGAKARAALKEGE